MKKKRTVAYRFRIGTESAKFRKAYDDELGRLRLAYQITELREKRGLTQAQLAEKVGVSRQAIIAIENGKYEPGLSLAMRIARVFRKRVEEVFTLED